MTKSLDELLHGPSALPVLVRADGTYETAPYPPATMAEYAPESIMIDYDGAFEDAQIMDTHERAAIDSVEGEWEVLTGWAGPGTLFIFDAGQRHFGRDLEEHIKETPGLWAIVSVEMYPPKCDAGKDGMPCAEYDAHERCEHADYPPESEAAGWALVHRNRAVTLGEDESEVEGRGVWPVLRDGKETGTHIHETERGYHFRAPHTMTDDRLPFRAPSRPFRDSARKDAEEWLTENVA